MKTDVEELGPTRVKLTIEVPFEELKGSLDKAYREVGRQVRVPGFRPGRVPPRIIDQRFGRGVVLEQAVNEAVPQLYGQALQENDVFALGQPDLEITKLDDGKELAFTAEVDVRPKFEIPDLTGLPVTVDTAVVTPDEVEEYIGGLRERFASLKGVDRPVEDGDFTSIDLSASVNGEPVEDAQVSGYSYQVGSGSLLDGLDEALTGMSAGETKHLQRRAGRRGARRRAGRRDRDRAQRQGQGTARAGRRVRPVRQRVRHARRVPRRDPGPAGGHEADAAGRPGAGARAGRGARPRSTSRCRTAWSPARPRCGASRSTSSWSGRAPPWTPTWSRRARPPSRSRRTWSESARRSVKAGFVLDQLARQEELGIEQDELNSFVIEQAYRMGVQPDRLAQELADRGQIGSVITEVLRGKALTLITERATVTDEAGQPVDVSAPLQPDETAETGEAADAEAGPAGSDGAQDSPADATRRPRGQCRRGRCCGGRCCRGQCCGGQCPEGQCPEGQDPEAQGPEGQGGGSQRR